MAGYHLQSSLCSFRHPSFISCRNSKANNDELVTLIRVKLQLVKKNTNAKRAIT